MTIYNDGSLLQACVGELSHLPPPECGDIGGKVLLEIDKRNFDGLLELVSEDLHHVKMLRIIYRKYFQVGA